MDMNNQKNEIFKNLFQKARKNKKAVLQYIHRNQTGENYARS